MLMPAAAVLLGLALLVWGSDRFVLGASAMARNLGVPPLLVGLTVVAVGTSAPEILVATAAALAGTPSLAVGNALGSNIANMGLVIGVTALLVPLRARSRTLKREFVLMYSVFVVAALAIVDGTLVRADGVLLLAAFVLLMGLIVAIGVKARRRDPLGEEYALQIPSTLSNTAALFWFATGLLTLLLSARLIVWGAVQIALQLGVSDLIIGLTIVAIGTSLPELAASIASAVKREPDIAIGNVIGSNMFNMLPVLAAPGLLAPGPIPADAVSRDFVIMVVLSVLLYLLAYGTRGQGRIGRWEGGALLAVFCAYQLLLYVSSEALRA